MEEPRLPLKASAPDTPDAVASIVAKCLEPDPAKRYQTSAELEADLARLDDEGKVIPVARRLTKKLVLVAAVVVIALIVGTSLLTRQAVQPAQGHEPISVVIADLEDRTNDSAFNGTLEPMLRRALQDASFISAYDRSAVASVLGVQAPARFDQTAARELAANQGLGVVLAGFIEPQGSRYRIGAKVLYAVSGEEIADVQERASTRDEVLEAATRLIARVRSALGDDTSESAQLFAMKSITATSLDVVRDYAAAVDAQSRGKYEEAEGIFRRAVERDPTFGPGYLGLGGMARNLGRPQEAEQHTNEALKYLGSMTERERFNTRAFSYRLSGDYQRCVNEYGELVKKYPADPIARSQRGLCSSKLRDMNAAVDEMRQVVQLVPKRAQFRGNLAVYSAYAGQFPQAEHEAQQALSIDESYDLATLSLAFGQLGQGRLTDAAAAYQKLGAVSARGKSWAAAGLGDLAIFEGRFSDGIRFLQDGAAADLASKTPARAARKEASIAYAHLSLGQTAPAIAAASRAVKLSTSVEVRFLAARVFAEAGEIARADALAAELESVRTAEPQAYAKIIRGNVALKNGDAPRAIALFTEANGILDTWLGHFDLGRAHLTLRAYIPADSEFDRCIQRRGEALSLLVDEEPTSGYFPIVYYYQGLVREGFKSPDALQSHKQYLAIRGNSKEDPILVDIQRRIG
jgi:tetratricopeptide (TPR) repeat protein